MVQRYDFESGVTGPFGAARPMRSGQGAPRIATSACECNTRCSQGSGRLPFPRGKRSAKLFLLGAFPTPGADARTNFRPASRSQLSVAATGKTASTLAVASQLGG
jgi:hypothetical protein